MNNNTNVCDRAQGRVDKYEQYRGIYPDKPSQRQNLQINSKRQDILLILQ